MHHPIITPDDGESRSYHPTESAAKSALESAKEHYGSALRLEMISPPNHDRPHWMLTLFIDMDRYQTRPYRSLSGERVLGELGC